MTAIPIFRPKLPRQQDVLAQLGIPCRGAGLHRAIEAGVPYLSFVRLAQLLSLDERVLSAAMGIAPATLRRSVLNGRFNRSNSDTIYRIALIFTAARELFEGDSEVARRWLTKPVKGLGSRRPVEMAVTSAHTADALELIGRLEHGIAA